MKESDYGLRVEALRDKLFKVAMLYTGNATRAVDILDEAIYKGLKNCRKLRDEDLFDAWMVKILMNECHKEYNRTKKVSPMDEEEMNLLNTVSMISEMNLEDHVILQDALDRLPEELRQIIIMRYFNGYTQEEAAKLLKIPQGTLVTRQRRALELMKESLTVTDERTKTSLKRAKRRNLRRKLIETPALTLLVLSLSFGLLVNLSPAIALACSDIPIISTVRDFFTMGRYAKSLEEAIRHDYLQKLELSAEDHGFELFVDSVVVDERQINILYQIHSLDKTYGDDYVYQIRSHSFKDQDGIPIYASVVTESYTGNLNDQDTLQRINIDFSDQGTKVPDYLDMHLDIVVYQDKEGEAINYFELDTAASFDLAFSLEEDQITNGKFYEIEKSLTCGDQSYTLKSLSVYPTKMELVMEADDENKCELILPKLHMEHDGEKLYGGNFSRNERSSQITVSFDSIWFSDICDLSIIFEGVYVQPYVCDEVSVDMSDGFILKNPSLGIACIRLVGDEEDDINREEGDEILIRLEMKDTADFTERMLDRFILKDERGKMIDVSSTSSRDDKDQGKSVTYFHLRDYEESSLTMEAHITDFWMSTMTTGRF